VKIRAIYYVFMHFYDGKCVLLHRFVPCGGTGHRYLNYKTDYLQTMRSITPVVKNLLIINVLCFVAQQILPRQGIDLESICGLHFFVADEFRPWQFVTYMFMHGNLEHLFFNMFALWMFGCLIERTQGSKRFIIYYVVCGLGAGLCQEIAQYIHYLNLDMMTLEDGQKVIMMDGAYYTASSVLRYWNCVGASGAIYGILLAFAMYYPNERIFLYFLIPLKAKYLVLGYAVIEMMSVLTSAHDGVAHIAHLGGMIFGVLLILWWRNQDKNRGHRAEYVNFDSYKTNRD